jgi:hypothetical protein
LQFLPQEFIRNILLASLMFDYVIAISGLTASYIRQQLQWFADRGANGRILVIDGGVKRG